MLFKKSQNKENNAENNAAEIINTENQKPSIKEWIKQFLKDVVPVAIIAYLLFGVIFHIVIVSGPSMEPTYDSGDVVITSKMFYTPQNGDIVVFDKDNVLQGKNLIKRVVAISGQTIDIDYETGAVFIDGKEIEESYIKEPTFVDLGIELPLTVPEGYVFVMGDNRNNSNDSRSPDIGIVSEKDISGRVLISFDR